jgi:NAD(P)-dependent dehydrogenase (short-subunit alcohol dehydrogenase family)
MVAARSSEKGAALRKELGDSFDYTQGDLCDPETAVRCVVACVSRFGGMHAVYNVAGISGRRWGDGPVHECTDEGWAITLANNLTSTFYVCRAAVRHFLSQPVGPNGLRGTVLNMTSVLGYSPQRDYFATHAYAATKGGIIALTKSMAAAYAAAKINVNAIAPALIRTPMSARAQGNEDVLALMKTKQPLAEDLIEADDVARASVFLLSDDARFITGEVLGVDAGWAVSG